MIRRHRMRSPDRNWRSGRMVGLSSRGIDPVNSGFRQLAVYRPKVTLPNGRHAGDTTGRTVGLGPGSHLNWNTSTTVQQFGLFGARLASKALAFQSRRSPEAVESHGLGITLASGALPSEVAALRSHWPSLSPTLSFQVG